MGKELLAAIEAVRKVTDPDEVQTLWRTLRDHDHAIRGLEAQKKVVAGVVAVGAKIQFDARSRGVIRGTVVKVNQKSAKVLADDGKKWNVSIALIQPVSP